MRQPVGSVTQSDHKYCDGSYLSLSKKLCRADSTFGHCHRIILISCDRNDLGFALQTADTWPTRVVGRACGKKRQHRAYLQNNLVNFFRHHDRKRRDAVIRRAVLDLIGLGIVESSLAWS